MVGMNFFKVCQVIIDILFYNLSNQDSVYHALENTANLKFYRKAIVYLMV